MGSSQITVSSYSYSQFVSRLNSKVRSGYMPLGEYYTTENLNREPNSSTQVLYQQDLLRIESLNED